MSLCNSTPINARWTSFVTNPCPRSAGSETLKTRNASCQMYGKGLQGEIRGVCEEAIHITVDYSILYPAAQTARLVMVPSSLEQCRVTLEVQIIHYTLVSEVAARLQLDELRNPLLTASTLRAPVFARLIMRHPHPDRVVRVGGEACAADMTLGPLFARQLLQPADPS